MTLPPLSPEPQYAPHDPNRAPFNSPEHDRLALVGLVLGVLAGALVLIGAFGDRMIASSGLRFATMGESSYIVIGVISMVLLAGCIALPWAWARYTGIVVLALAASTCFLIVIGSRTDDRFLFRGDITLHRGGWILYAAGVVFTLGLALALIGAPRIGRAPRPEGAPVATSGYAVASLVLALCGLFSGVTATLGVAFAVAAFDDIRRSAGTRGGRGMAVAGLVVGLVILAGVVLFALIGSLVAEPSVSQN